MFILIIRLNTNAQSSKSNNSIENLPLNSNFSKLINSTTRFINVINTTDTILFSSENTTKTVIFSSIFLNSTHIPNIFTNSTIKNRNGTSINVTHAVEDVLNTMNTTISSKNSTRIISLTATLYNTSNNSSVKVNESVQEMTNVPRPTAAFTIHTINNNTKPFIYPTGIVYDLSSVSNDTMNSSNSFNSGSFDLLANTTATIKTTTIISKTNVNSTNSSLENNTTSNILISTLINLINSTQRNQLNKSSLLNNTTSLSSSAVINTNTTNTLSIRNPNATVQPMENFSISVTNTGERSNSSKNTTFQNFDVTMLSFMNSSDNELLNRSDSSNTTLATLPSIVNTMISNFTYQSLLPSANDTLTQTLSITVPTTSSLTMNQQTSSNDSLKPASPSLSNENLTLLINTSQTVTPLMSEMTGLPLFTTNLSNENLSSFSNMTDTRISTTSLGTESAQETVQQTDHTPPTILSTLIFSKDNLLLTSNTTQTNNSTESIISPQLQNTTQRTNDTIVSTPALSDESNGALSSEPYISELSTKQDVFLNSTQKAFFLDSIPTELPSATIQATLGSVPPNIPSTNLSNQSSSEVLNSTQETVPLDSLPAQLSTATIEQTLDTLPPIMPLINISNESSPQLLNSTQEAFALDSVPTELSSATMQPTPDTLSPTTSSTNLSNQSSPEVLNITQATVPLDSFQTGLPLETIQQMSSTLPSVTPMENLLDQSSPASLNGSNEGVSVDSLPTGIASSTMQTTPITLASPMPSINISNESLLVISTSTEGTASADSLWTGSLSTTMVDTADSFPSVTPSTNVSGETLVGISNSTQVDSPSDSLATNLPTVISENITNTFDFIAISSSSVNNTDMLFGSASLSTEVPSFTAEATMETIQSSQVPLAGSSETMSSISNLSDVNVSSTSIPTEEMSFATLQTVEAVSLESSPMEPNQSVPTLSTDIQTDSSNHSMPTLMSFVTEQETWDTSSSTPVSSFPLNDSLVSSANVTSTNSLPISEATEITSGTAESTDNIREPIVTSSISPNESLPSSFNETQTNMSSSSMSTIPSFITVQNSLDTFPSEQFSASISNENESVLLTTVQSSEVDISFASQPMISSTITVEQATNNFSVTQSSAILQNETLPSYSSNTLQETSSDEGIINIHTTTIEQTTDTLISRSIPSIVPNQDSTSPISLDTIANSQTGNTEEMTQPSMFTESLLSTLAETNPTETIYTNNGIDTAESSSITIQVTVATPMSLLTRLMSSPLSQSTLFSSINDYTEDKSASGSTETNFVSSSTAPLFLSEELTIPNQYSTNPDTSNLLLLLSTLISHSEVITSTIPTINSMPISVTESTSFIQSSSEYSTAFSSSISSPISLILNTNPDISTRDSTSAANINTINSVSSSQQVPESLETIFTITDSMALETTPTIISSIQSSSVTPASTLSNDVTSVPSETLTNTFISFSSIAIDNEQTTMNTILVSNALMSESSSTPIISSSFETSTTSNSLPSLNSINDVPSTFSSNIQDTTSNENPSSSTFNTMFLTLISTSTPFSDSFISSQMTTPTISTSTITNRDTTFLSLLLATSGLLMSNETSTTQDMISSIPFTTQINSNTTTATSSSDCVFPFRYLGQWYERCISDILNDSWCSLTADFDRDRQWKYCRAPRVKTIGGTGNGSDCVFPFIYQGTLFSTCIYRTETAGTTKSFSLFCSVTSNLDQNGLWGYCLDYGSCYFPFIFNGNTYSDCISGPQSARWCSTTANFDRNKMWSNCPGMLLL
ncbi:unnamed protein product [Rotaria sp. Silwood2]|nr:unnamed protein product [Rotaria sp. Silwood2]CAF2499661.1 unnamed protein product [Rotaria sp. Silwood2]CAF4012029.1 unnamed protein product [Rotaria sp. Silwood2]CAF4047024.1 unnamed protein product [Rotaria sp. Silwood2]